MIHEQLAPSSLHDEGVPKGFVRVEVSHRLIVTSINRFDESVQNKEDSIPFQLQKLFARLQLVNDAAATLDLIQSFGWDKNQSFEQNDVQEFCRVLFEALNTTFEGTAQSSMLSDLYDGVISDSLQCTE